MARKQEQESASEEVEEVGRGVLRMQLPIRMPGLGHVNMYAILDGDGATVVDPGLPGRGTWRAIQQRLRQADLRVRDVHTVVVTHSHPDHFGGAARFAREAGAEVIAHRGFRFGVAAASPEPEVSVDDLAAQREAAQAEAGEAAEADGGSSGSAQEAAHTHSHASAMRSWNTTTPWGGRHPRPSLKVRLRWQAARWLGRSFIPMVSRPVGEGDVLRLGGREWFVVHTPGHTEDHICLHDPEEALFLAGDHVLPTITPHISGISVASDPLDAFFESLTRVGAIDDVRLCLPAHGHPFEDLSARTEAIKRHHVERLDKVKGIGQMLGPSTVEAFSRKLFKPRSWGSMAESETYAHLEHLRHAGDAERRTDSQGRFVYQTG